MDELGFPTQPPQTSMHLSISISEIGAAAAASSASGPSILSPAIRFALSPLDIEFT